jgi:hypothetical protein
MKLNQKDQIDVGAYLEACSTHSKLMDQYWATSTLSPGEKLERTANRVGLQLPKQFEADK